MDMKNVGVLLVFVLIIVIGAAVVLTSKTPGAQNPQLVAPSTTNNTNSNMTLFSSTQYAQFAYLIYPGAISQQSQLALSGFNLTTSLLQNGSTKATISLIGSGQSQAVTIRPSYKLYIVDSSLGDDSYHFDSSIGDDGFVVVDNNGYIAQ